MSGPLWANLTVQPTHLNIAEFHKILEPLYNRLVQLLLALEQSALWLVQWI